MKSGLLAARAAATAVAALGACAGAFAQPVDTFSLRAEASHLDAGYAPWHEDSVGWRRAWSARHGLEASLSRVRRFGLEDRRLAVDYSQPLSQRLTLGAELAVSPTHQVLARHVAGARLAWEFQPQWLMHTGLRHSRYNDTAVRQARLGVERYAGAFGASLAWQPARAGGTSTASVALRADWYHGEHSSVGLVLAEGTEAARVQADRTERADVRSVALVGRQALAPGWSVAYGLERTKQGRFYTRTGVSLALSHDF